MSAPDFATGVLAAVNHSGDSDSTGSIAGSLLGARLGVEAIPPEWLDALELRDVIDTTVDDVITEFWGDPPDTDDWFARYPGW